LALPPLFRLYVNVQGLAEGKKRKAPEQKAAALRKKKWRRPKGSSHRTRPELLAEMLALLAGWFPDRAFVVCADSAYAGKSVFRHLPANADLISQVHPQGVLYAPPPPQQQGQRERPARRGTGGPT
jgi:hypothetical protein